MRIALVALLSALGLVAAAGTGAWADDKADVGKELKKFQGAWTFESVEAGGKKLPAEQFKAMTLVVEGDKYSVKMGDQVVEAGALKIDPSKSPKTIDSKVTEGPNKDKLMLGIYEFGEETLKVCFDEGTKRPTEFKTAEGSEAVLVVHKRVKK